mgnify:CR=1 FL=1
MMSDRNINRYSNVAVIFYSLTKKYNEKSKTTDLICRTHNPIFAENLQV